VIAFLLRFWEVLARRSVKLTETFRGIPQLFQANAGIVSQITPLPLPSVVGIAQYVERRATGWTAGLRFPAGEIFSSP
jgi:hypothetical protein